MRPGFTVAASSSGGISIGFLLTIIFVILKLTNAIAWSWLAVFLPLIISAGLSILFTIVFVVMVAILFVVADD